MPSTDILQRALDAWGEYTYPFDYYARLHESLVECKANADVMNYLLGSLERYIQQERMSTLDQHWGGAFNGTPQEAEFVSVPPELMHRIQGIVGFYGVNRVFLFLYIHAYLWHKVHRVGPLGVLNCLVDELDPR